VRIKLAVPSAIWLFVMTSSAWPTCCAELDFSVGQLDRNQLESACGALGASDATAVSWGAATIFRIEPDHYIFVHDEIGCIPTVFQTAKWFITDDPNSRDRRVLITSLDEPYANLSVSWDENDFVVSYSAISLSVDEQ
jgi:hypothetical protein